MKSVARELFKRLYYLKENAVFTYRRIRALYRYREEWRWYLQENVSEWGQHNDLIRNYAWIDFLDEKEEIELEELYPQGDDNF